MSCCLCRITSDLLHCQRRRVAGSTGDRLTAVSALRFPSVKQAGEVAENRDETGCTMPSSNRWKRRERETAAALGVTRLPSNGRAQADIHAGGWAIEHKSRESLPAWLTVAVNQARRNTPAGMRPAVVLTAGQGAGKPLRRLVVLELADWAAMVIPPAPAEDGAEPRPVPQDAAGGRDVVFDCESPAR